MKPPPLPPPVLCLVHPHNHAIGTCRRCQQPFCDICRSAWRDEIVCLACLNQLISGADARPGEARMQKRQAIRSLTLAVLGWSIFLVSAGMVWSMREGRGDRDFAVLTLMTLLASFVPALFSLGQSVANIRSRGQHVVLSTWSLVIASLQLGLLISVILLNISHN
jgi:hypothetical protein